MSRSPRFGNDARRVSPWRWSFWRRSCLALVGGCSSVDSPRAPDGLGAAEVTSRGYPSFVAWAEPEAAPDAEEKSQASLVCQLVRFPGQACGVFSSAKIQDVCSGLTMTTRVRSLWPWLVLLSSALEGCAAHTLPVEPQGVEEHEICDRLEPMLSPRMDAPDAAEDARILAATLFPLETGDSPTMIMVKDGMFPPEAVYLTNTTLGLYPGAAPDWRVVHVRAHAFSWPGNENLEVTRTEQRIDAEAVRTIESAWLRMVAGARWRGVDKERRVFYGAKTYSFEHVSTWRRQGTVTAPGPGTCAAGLAELGEALIRYADTDDDKERAKVHWELLRRAEPLAERARFQVEDW